MTYICLAYLHSKSADKHLKDKDIDNISWEIPPPQKKNSDSFFFTSERWRRLA